jgi:heme O synthase-like polyprenyltransferase
MADVGVLDRLDALDRRFGLWITRRTGRPVTDEQRARAAAFVAPKGTPVQRMVAMSGGVVLLIASATLFAIADQWLPMALTLLGIFVLIWS